MEYSDISYCHQDCVNKHLLHYSLFLKIYQTLMYYLDNLVYRTGTIYRNISKLKKKRTKNVKVYAQVIHFKQL